MNEMFRKFSHRVSVLAGSPGAFALALLALLAWAATGPLFHYSDTWQLVINTGTTIVTFLIVFLIQNTQNRDARATHLKLDELVRAIANARNSMLDVQDLPEEDMERLQKEFQKLREQSAARARHLASE